MTDAAPLSPVSPDPGHAPAVHSPALLLALRDLDRTDGKALLKAAVKELVARRMLTISAREPTRWRGRPRLVLIDGPERMPMAHERFLVGVAQMIAGAPASIEGDRVARDLGNVAKHLAKQPHSRKRAVAAALADLMTAGLVTTEQRKALGMFSRTVHVRTPAGEARLRKWTRRRTGDDTFYLGVYGGDPGPCRDIDSSFDSGFDASFDSSFDASFDSSFDAGFFSGDGGGGGGDGGGGGN